MKKKLADVLWEAANVHLCVDGGGSDHPRRCQKRFSCNAIFDALGLAPNDDLSRDGYFPLPGKIVSFVGSLGCNTKEEDYFSGMQFASQQSVRYMWLLLAMHVAEDEGIMVEVAE